MSNKIKKPSDAFLLKWNNRFPESFTFWLHYGFTCVFLIAVGSFLELEVHLTGAISCTTTGKDSTPKTTRITERNDTTYSPFFVTMESAVPLPMLNMYCYSHFYTLLNQSKEKSEDNIFYHGYYHSVGVLLYLQAFLFYLPHFLWKILERGHMDNILKVYAPNDQLGKIKKASESYGSEDLSEISKSSESLPLNDAKIHEIHYLSHSLKLYLLVFNACKTLNTVVVIAQIFILNINFGEHLQNYVLKTLGRNVDSSPLFPDVGLCDFHSYDSSGNNSTVEAVCVLSMNHLYAPLYLAIYLWLWFLIFVNAFTPINALLIFYSSTYRAYLLWLFGRGLTFQICKGYSDKNNFRYWIGAYFLVKKINPVKIPDIIEKLKENDNCDHKKRLSKEYNAV